jgi:hypothetical protein
MMPTPKKSLLACVSAAALVASFGFVQAQSSDQDAAAMANVNGGVDRGEDARSYPSDTVGANTSELAYEAPAAGTAEPSTSPWAADSDNSTMGANAQASSDTAQAVSAGSTTTTSDSQGAQAGGYQRDVGVDGTPCIPEGSVGQKSATYDPAVSGCPGASTTATSADATAPAAPVDTAPAAAAPPAATPDSNMTVTSAPETRIDLNSPSEPLYNLPGGERAPRPDRN